MFQTEGHCPSCDCDVTFTAHNEWYRDHFVCGNCGSIPRERALMAAIEMFYPQWREATIHESSPADRATSLRLANGAATYIPSQYFPDIPSGTLVGTYRSENLEDLSFADNSIDIHVTQDVLEHVFHPSKVFSEIARTLKPGGMHIFTVPIVNKMKPSNVRARMVDDQIVHVEPEEYHGSPVGDGRSLVTMDWGYDICRSIFEASGLFTHLLYMDDLSRGIRAEYIEVLVTVKPDESTRDSQIP